MHDPSVNQPGPDPSQPTRSGRRRLGCLAKTGCGLLAFVVGAGLMLAFLVPPLLGRWAGRQVEQEFEATRQGDLRVEGVRLDWFRRQSLGEAYLHDPQGVRVARAQLEMPSILELLRAWRALEAGERTERLSIAVHLDADVVVDEDGSSNLQRSLALRDDIEPEPPVRIEGQGPARLDEYLRHLDAEVRVSSSRISVSTPQTRAGEVELALEGLDARLTLAPGAPLRLVASAGSSGGGRLALEGRVEGLRLLEAGPAFDGARLEATLERMPTALIDAFVGQGADLVGLVGPQADGRLGVHYSPAEAARVELQLTGQGTAVHLSLVERGGVLELDPEVSNGASLAVPRGWLEAHLAPFLPPGSRVEPLGETVALALSLERFSLPLPGGYEPGSIDLGQLQLAARATLGGLELAFRPPAQEGAPPGPPIEQRLVGASVELALDPQAGLVARLAGELEPEGRFRAEARAAAAGVRAFLAGGPPAGPEGGLELDLEAQSFPTGMVDALGGQDGLLLDLLGPTLDASIELREIVLSAADPDPEGSAAQGMGLGGARVALQLGSREGRIAFRGRLVGSLPGRAGVVELDPDVSSGVSLAVPRRWLEARLAPLLPPGTRVVPIGDSVAVTLSLDRLTLPLPAADDPGGLDPSQLRLAARATLGGLELAFTPAAQEGAPPGRPVEQRVSGVSLELDLDPQAGLVASLAGELEPEGRLRAEARAPAAGVRAFLAGEPTPVPEGAFELDASAEGFPTELVDALARQDGLLLDVLGPTLDASLEAREIALGARAPGSVVPGPLEGGSVPRSVEGSSVEGGSVEGGSVEAGWVDTPGDPLARNPAASEAAAAGEPGAGGMDLEAARLVARLESGLGRVDFSGRVVGTRLVATGEEGLSATARLSPLLSSRIIGPLVPLLVGLEKPAGAEPLRIAVRNLSLPLDADRGQIDALVRLELGDIRAQILPSLGELLHGIRELRPEVHRMVPFEVRVERGVASYEALPIVLDGKRIDLAGSVSLVDGRLDLRTELPLRHLGGDVRGALREVEALVSPDLAVPVSLVGSLGRPRLRVPEDFIQDLVRNAARRGLEEQLQQGAREGLRDILDRLKKKDG